MSISEPPSAPVASDVMEDPPVALFACASAEPVVHSVEKTDAGWLLWTTPIFSLPAIPVTCLVQLVDEDGVRRVFPDTRQPVPSQVREAVIRTWGEGIGSAHIPVAVMVVTGGWRAWLPGRPSAGHLLVNLSGEMLQYWTTRRSHADASAGFNTGERTHPDRRIS